MQKTNTKKMGTGAALAIALMSFGAFVALASIVTKNQSRITPVSLADDSNQGDSQDSSSQDVSESAKNSAEKIQEANKKQAENTRESAKQQSERTRESNKQQSELLKGSESDGNGDSIDKSGDNNSGNEGDVNEVEGDNDADNVGGDNNGMFKDGNKTLAKLSEKLAEAEKHILEKQAEGVDVTAALANLALAKEKLTQVGASFTTNDLEAAKELSKEVEKTAIFTEKDLEFSKGTSNFVAEISKQFGKVDTKIAALVSLGGDASTYKTQLASLRVDFSVLQTTMTTTPNTVTRDMVKAIDRKVKQLKSSVERSIFALGGTDGEDLVADHEKDSQDLESDLNDVAEIESGDSNGVAKEVKAVAIQHRLASQDIKKSLEDIQNRGGVERVILGPDWNALDSLNTQVAAINVRADALASASDKITDPQIKQILVDQVTALRSEAAKLEAYISSENNQFSIFGKFLSLFR